MFYLEASFVAETAVVSSPNTWRPGFDTQLEIPGEDLMTYSQPSQEKGIWWGNQ